MTAPSSGANRAGWPELICAALDGDEAAWRTIVDQLAGVVWKVVNTYAMAESDREDAFASTFLRLFQKLDTVRQPDRLPGWAASVAHNEAKAVWRFRQRTVPVAEVPLRELDVDTVGEHLLDEELLAAVFNAVGTMTPAAQALLRLLTAVPPLSYNDISELLDMPKGSIGPTAGRHLTQLRRLLSSYYAGDPR